MSKARSWLAVGGGAMVVAMSGCASDRIGVVGEPVDAMCEATVRTGRKKIVVDVEREYLPRVILCENGAADGEALKALAVAARSYLYYTLAREGSIGDGTSDQVFGCARDPEPRHVAAVVATAGEVLQYRGRQVAGFYVAGALPGPQGCRGGRSDPTGTESYVTYNEGRSGDQVIQTALGLRLRRHAANRGGMSQNGSRCLAEAGYDYRSILRYYYGEDIALASAVGRCVHDEREAGPPVDRRRLALIAAALCAAALWWWRGRRPGSGRRRRKKR